MNCISVPRLRGEFTVHCLVAAACAALLSACATMPTGTAPAAAGPTAVKGQPTTPPTGSPVRHAASTDYPICHPKPRRVRAGAGTLSGSPRPGGPGHLPRPVLPPERAGGRDGPGSVCRLPGAGRIARRRVRPVAPCGRTDQARTAARRSCSAGTFRGFSCRPWRRPARGGAVRPSAPSGL
jgi:hypothetical protein